MIKSIGQLDIKSHEPDVLFYGKAVVITQHPAKASIFTSTTNFRGAKSIDYKPEFD